MIGPALVAGLVGLAALAMVTAWINDRAGQGPSATSIRPIGIPVGISTQLADFMAPSSVPTMQAPDFALVDQHDRPLELSSLRGSVVVLEFMDPHCTDICPIISQELVEADRDLGNLSQRVDFIAVNVNPFHEAPADMAAYSTAHGLNSIPTWHFVTGSTAALSTVWKNYGTEVEAPSPNADVVHGTTVFFLDPSGRERFVATPMADYSKSGVPYLPAGPLASWAKGIALVARDLAKRA